MVDSNGCEVVQVNGQRLNRLRSEQENYFADEFPTGWTVGSEGMGVVWFEKFITTSGDVVDLEWRLSRNGCP